MRRPRCVAMMPHWSANRHMPFIRSEENDEKLEERFE
jgi:hypothetical protein